MSLRSRQPGFTLLELIISFAVMAIVVFGSVSIYITSIRLTASQTQRFIAYSLAQEGVEGVRNLRDTYFKQSLDWRGTSGTKLVSSLFAKGEYVIARKTPLQLGGNQLLTDNDPQREENVRKAVPWIFESYKGDLSGMQHVYLVEISGTNYYTQRIGGSQATMNEYTATPFDRIVRIEFLDPKTGDVTDAITDRLRVTTRVTWKEHNNDRELELTTELTNWKQGPL